MRDLVIVGAGDHGRETLDIIEAVNAETPTWNFLGYVDDEPFEPVRGQLPRGEHLGPTDVMERLDADYVLGIGTPVVRARLDAQLSDWGRRAATLVHPLASCGADNRLADGVLMAAGARITTNVELGRHVHLNVNAVVSHDGRIGDHVTISPGVHVAGRVTVGARSYLGIGSIVNPGMTVGGDVMVGAGAVVVCDVPDDVTVKGVPGRWE